MGVTSVELSKCRVSLEFLLMSLLIRSERTMNNHFAGYRKQNAAHSAPGPLSPWRKHILCQQWMNFKWDYSCCMGFWYMLWFFFLCDKNVTVERGDFPAREERITKFIGSFSARENFPRDLRCIAHFSTSPTFPGKFPFTCCGSKISCLWKIYRNVKSESIAQIFGFKIFALKMRRFWDIKLNCAENWKYLLRSVNGSLLSKA